MSQYNAPRSQAIYVIVRKDLPRSAQAVQGGHALAQFLLEHRTDWSNGTLVYLGVRDELTLSELKAAITNTPCSEFREPDLNDQLTAIAVLGSGELTNSDFPDLRLL